jgi:hypothetical protein
MRNFVLSLLAFFAPTSAFALTAQDKVDIAERLTKAYPAITVTVESRPVISGDLDPTIFRISRSGKQNFGNLFLNEHYDIIYKPNANHELGSYLCDLANEFVRERRRAQADFFPSFTLRTGLTVPISFEIGADRETLRGIVQGLMTLWDFLAMNDYGKFNILVRGYADRGAAFQRPVMPEYPYHDVSYLPLARQPDPLLAVYVRRPQTKNIGNTYSNSELPNLRATFLKREVIDRFLDECRLSRRPLTPESVVLDGAVIDVKDPEYRTIDLYFYAYR